MAVLFLTAHSTLFFSNMLSGTWGGANRVSLFEGERNPPDLKSALGSSERWMVLSHPGLPAGVWPLEVMNSVFSVGSVRVQLPLPPVSSASLQFSLKLRPSRTPCIPVSAQAIHHGLYLLVLSSGFLTSKDANAGWSHRFRSSGCITTLSCLSASFHSPRGT